MCDISDDRMNDLLRKEEVLDALLAGGVQDWEWYDSALEDANLEF